jgi:hypothetical protein
LASFFTCVSLVIGTPLGIRYYILHARTPQSVTLEVQRGPLRVTLAGRGEPIAIAEKRDGIPQSTTVATDFTSGRLVLRAPRTDGPIIAAVQLYDNTEIVLSSARSPRYPVSRLPHEIVLELRAGHVRIHIFDDGNRPTIATVRTPYGSVALVEGSYEVEVNAARAQVTVHAGQAEISGLNTLLEPAERAIMDAEGNNGPQPAAPNLVTDGDFVSPLEGIWSAYNKIDDPSEPAGEVQTATVEAIPAVIISRQGQGHAETGITQELNADVSSLRTLQLHLLLRVEEQDVPVCGSLGSECPVMVRIDYVDANGADQEWTQGFYWLPDPNMVNPTACSTCSTHNEHHQVPLDTWYAYLSPNLILQLSQGGQPPRLIKSIAIYASGHTYRATVAEVELIGQ